MNTSLNYPPLRPELQGSVIDTVCLPLLEMALTDDHPWWACECGTCAAVWAGDRVAV